MGVLRSGASESLLKLMTGVYVPAVLGNTSWPDSVRKDFTGQLHKFMAFLTELTNDAKGVTVLYIPEEDLRDPAVSCKEKELVQVRFHYSLCGEGYLGFHLAEYGMKSKKKGRKARSLARLAERAESN